MSSLNPSIIIPKLSLKLGFMGFTVILFLLLGWLSLWQFERGQQAQLRIDQHYQQQNLNPIYINNLNHNLSDGQRIYGEALARFDRTLLLDNQVLNKKVGYRQLVPVELASGQWLLVDLGFVVAGLSRNELPSINSVPEHIEFTAQVYQPSINQFNRLLLAEEGWPKRIQTINLKQIQQQFNWPLLNFIAIANQVNGEAVPSNFSYQVMSPAKHFGYSLQWALMAIVEAFLSVLIWRKWAKE
ncbi:SURF1 family protein [Paraferrimonas sp. SM1919]|uniref:SURF1 family protein n=1 Tax=Paraferrimonas sp. SM1919 TaxID=2662263 RepID=UPI001F08F368|nr:SURF1 family protein [Paraferrimonas sp. SM1919]